MVDVFRGDQGGAASATQSVSGQGDRTVTPSKINLPKSNEWRNHSGAISLAVLTVTTVCINGRQTASVPQVVAFGTTFALSTILTVIAFRRGAFVNWVFAMLAGVVQFGLFFLIFVFS